MRVCMTLLVRDEEDILEAHLDFHFSRGVDFILVTDNLSVDRTPEILAGYERRGLVRVLSQPRDDYSQSEWVTRMARLAWEEHGADWILHSDADEFWWPEAETLPDLLAAAPPGVDIVEVPRSDLVPRPEGLGSLFERMTLRRPRSRNSLGRPLPPKVLHRAVPGVVVRPGNHGVEGPGLDPRPGSLALSILHLPLRSFSQFRNKIRRGGAAVEGNAALDSGVCDCWRWLLELEGKGELHDYWKGQVVRSDQVLAALGAGELVPDTRLRDALPRLGREPEGRVAPWPLERAV